MQEKNIEAKLVWCILGLVKANLPVFGFRTIPCFTHFWGEVEGKRFETLRPLGSAGGLGIIPSKIEPIITIKFKLKKTAGKFFKNNQKKIAE